MDTKSGEDFFLGKDPTGSRLSFVSATDVRYEGTLVQVSEEHGLIILSEVYCFGTENRKAQRYVENKGYLDILLVVSKGQVKRAEIVPEESEEEQDDDDEESLEADEDSGGDASSQTGTLEEEDCSQAPEQSLDLDAENDEKESGFVDSESVAGSTSAPIIPADETCDEPPMLYKQMLLKDAYSSQGSLNTLGQLPPRTWKVPMAMSKKKLKETLFPEYSIPEDLEELLRASPNLQYLDHLHLEEDVILDYLNWMFGEGLNEKNYKEFQSFYLYIEEMAMDEELTKFDMFSVEFSSEKLKKPQVKVDIPGMIDKCPNVIKGDLIHAHRHGQWYSLRVKETYQSKAILESVEFREEAFPNHRIKKAHADIQFTVNRCNLRSMHRSITLIKKEDIKRIFPPPEASHIKAWKSLLKPKDLSLFNKSLRSNQEQMQAVLKKLREGVQNRHSI